VDDIVQELRDWAYIADEAAGKVNFVMLNGSVFSSAADEIERLRSSAAFYPEYDKGNEIKIHCGDEEISTPEEMRAEIRRLTKLNEALEEQTRTHVFGNTQIMDEDGNLLAVLEGDVNRVVIKEAIERHVNTILEEFLKSEGY